MCIKKNIGLPVSPRVTHYIHPLFGAYQKQWKIKGKKRGPLKRAALIMESVLALLQRKLSIVVIVVGIRHRVVEDNAWG